MQINLMDDYDAVFFGKHGIIIAHEHPKGNTMPFCRLFYHFTWSTKYRLPTIDACFETDLHNAIVSKAKDIGGIIYAIGGTETHVHLAVAAPPTKAITAFIGEVKGSSSHFVNQMFHPAVRFEWQKEYGVVTFGEKQLDVVLEYVKNQKKHHSDNELFLSLEFIDDKTGMPAKSRDR